MLPSQSNIRILCLTAFALHGVYIFSVRLFYPVLTGAKHQITLGQGQIKAYYMVLASTAVCGVTIWLDGVDMQNASNKLLISLIPWVMETGHIVLVYLELTPANHFRSAVDGAISSALLVTLAACSCEFSRYTTNLAFHAVGIVISLSLLIGFLIVPRQEDTFVQGRLIDRQHSGSLLELVTFSWHRELFRLQSLQTLKVKDLPILCSTSRSKYLSRRHVQFAHQNSHRSLNIILAKMYIGPLLLQWSFAVLNSLVILIPELITYHLLQWLGHEQERSISYGVGLALLLGLSKLSEVFVGAWLKWVTASKLQLPIQAALSLMCYQKALRLSNTIDSTEGSDFEKSNLAQMRTYGAKACVLFTDAQRIVMTIAKLVSIMAFLVSLIGWKSLSVGLLASALTMPLTVVVSKKYGISQTEQARFHERRLAILTDALLAIRQIKLSAVEGTWRQKVQQFRDQELKQLFTGALWMSCLVFVANIRPMILAGVPIYVFTWQGKQLTASIAFTSINLFRQLQSDISILPLTTPPLWEAWINLRRLDAFFAMDELDTAQISLPNNNISVDEANVTWHGNGNKKQFALNGLSMEFPDGELSIITGKTGSGKSLLLAAIAGEASIISGTIHRPRCAGDYDTKISNDWISPGTMALVTQSPWMANTTIRENILFGLPLEKDRYNSVVISCALDKDFSMLKDGDSTKVGIKGVTLSGGQRWRVAVARALYSRASVILLDDVLSAVDAEVREWIFERALMGGLAMGRTRILVTHHESQCIRTAAYHVHLCYGTAQVQTQQPSERENFKYESNGRSVTENKLPENPHTGEDRNSLDPALRKDADQISSQTPSDKGHSIRQTPYRQYFDATGGASSWLIVLLATAAYEVVRLATSWWLKEWASSQRQIQHHNSGYHPSLSYGTSYILMTTLSCFVTAARSFVWFKIGIKGSEKLFGMMTATLFGAPLQCLEKTSHGEILTRFGADMNTVDKRLPHDVGYLIECLSNLLAILFTSVSFSIYEIPIVAALLYLYLTIGVRLISATRKLKTIRLTASSSLQQHLNSLQAPDGILTVRAYGMSSYFIDQMCQLIDDNSSSFWYSTLCQVMMDFQLGALGALFITSIGLSIVLTETDAGTAGIALSFAMQFSSTMVGCLQRIATVESGLSSVGRIGEYSRLDQEPTSGIEVSASWPSKGEIRVDGLTVGYDASLPGVLNNLSFFINPGERVGIVGRTGAGKSSLILAFARLIPLRAGSIVIDGIDISEVKLDMLRRQLLIIPQDPYLFAGSLRSLLDPEGTHHDDILIMTLKGVQLTTNTVRKEEALLTDLSFMIEDGGSNISQGQRQILYLAKALLSRKKIVIMDEATSAVDMETDIVIQAAIRDGLPDTMVVVVAHRLATIVDFDKVLVLEDGGVVEFGAPRELYSQKGAFWKLVSHSSDKENLVARIMR